MVFVHLTGRKSEAGEASLAEFRREARLHTSTACAKFRDGRARRDVLHAAEISGIQVSTFHTLEAGGNDNALGCYYRTFPERNDTGQYQYHTFATTVDSDT
eukprot:scaffold2911_cov177-Amphora_coffeaeformis.AAC.11